MGVLRSWKSPFLLGLALTLVGCGGRGRAPDDGIDRPDPPVNPGPDDDDDDDDDVDPPPPPPRPPGALIEVRTQSQVGVVLDELPASVRDRVAAAFLVKPSDFWVERAKAQLAFTSYRLRFRSSLRNDPRRRTLHLPPQSVWQITLTGQAARLSFQGHDAIVVPYRLETAIVSDPSSVIRSEPELEGIGGEWTEEFELPLDPELVFQRTGYACVDENGNPPGSVDGENVPLMYNHDCRGAMQDERGCHDSFPRPLESCVQALEQRIGRVSASLDFERVAWNDARADQVRIEGWTETTAPDLVPLEERLADHRIVYRYIDEESCAVVEGCVGGSGWRRLLQFTAGVLNRGQRRLFAGDLDADSPFREHNVFEHSECHDHFHFANYASFDYGTAPGQKRAFCLLSTTRSFNDERTPMVQQFSCSYQGIEPGWSDEYTAGFECQWIDITDQPKVGQSIRYQLNPDGFLCEGAPVLDGNGDPVFEETGLLSESGEPLGRMKCTVEDGTERNNYLEEPVAEVDGFVTEPCARARIGPLRDCGFVEQPIRTCTPGEQVDLACQLGSAGPPQVVRVCEASAKLGSGTACTYRASLSNEIVEGTTQVSFTCPSARDDDEPGGRYALYLAPVVDGDASVPVSCGPPAGAALQSTVAR